MQIVANVEAHRSCVAETHVGLSGWAGVFLKETLYMIMITVTPSHHHHRDAITIINNYHQSSSMKHQT